MALMFPFDDTLNGHLEITNIKTGQLPFPIFTFPKGSFFVDRTYAINKATGKILRPGIDYRVLSCNETIPYSNDTTLNNKLKNSYVRNAILLRTTEDLDLDWHVYYAGGEENTKPAEYTNYINRLFNIAQTNATINLFTTPHQGWGSYLSPDNTQIMAGKYINSHSFQQEEERHQGGIGGLGWGKVEQALSYLADTVVHGNDPLHIQAFYNWIEHNDIEFLKVKNSAKDELTRDIDNLDRKRVDIEQYIYTDSETVSPNHKVIQHNNVVLRGIDNTITATPTTDPTAVKRETIGFYALAKGGFDVTALPTKLLQRKANNFTDTRQSIELGFSKSLYSQNSETIRININIGRTNINTNKSYKLYVTSRELGLLSTVDITTQIQTLSSTYINFTYPNQAFDFSTDVLFAYVLDENLEYTNCTISKADVIITTSTYGYKLAVNNHHAFIVGDSTNSNEDSVEAGGFEVVITRSFAVNSENLTLRFYIGDSKTSMQFNSGVSALTVNFARNEFVKRVFIKPKFETLNSPYIRAVVLKGTIEVDSLYIGVASVQKQTLANITVHTKADGNSYDWKYGAGTEAYLKVRFSKDTLFNGSDFTLVVSNYAASVVSVEMLNGIYVDNSTMIYPLVINGVVGSLFGIELKSATGTSISNRVNLAIGEGNAITVTEREFKTVIRGKHITQKHNGENWDILFDLEFNGDIPDGTLFEIINTTLSDVTFPRYAMARGERLMFSAKAVRFLNESFTLNLKQNNTTYTATVPASNVVVPIAFDQIVYTDGTIATTSIELNRPFKILVTNPYSDRSVTFTLDSYSLALQLTDVTYNSYKATASSATSNPFVNTLTLGPNETKQLNNDEWISITSLKSTLVGTLGVAGLFAPPYRIASVDLSGNVISSRDYLAIASYSVLDKIKVTSTNRVYGSAIYNMSDTINTIDIIISGIDLNGVSSLSVTHPQFLITTSNIVIDSINKVATLSLGVKLNRATELVEEGVTFLINLLDSSGGTVGIVESSLRVVYDV